MYNVHPVLYMYPHINSISIWGHHDCTMLATGITASNYYCTQQPQIKIHLNWCFMDGC